MRDQNDVTNQNTCRNCGIPLAQTGDGYTHIPERFTLDCDGPAPTPPGDLMGFIRARLVEQLRNGNWLGTDLQGTPARRQTGIDLIRDALAKRQIVELHARRRERHTFDRFDSAPVTVDLWTCAVCCDDRCPTWEEHGGHHRDPGLIDCCETLPLLALPYAGHPAYRDGWRP